eukprot:c10540_g1_i2.p1 GENE.c10540_g1_i2~~c10540_g1_i2.p1  ORF type:complete len:492 (+),score=63.46 c10540_g1_i2:1-1476(+)
MGTQTKFGQKHKGMESETQVLLEREILAPRHPRHQSWKNNSIYIRIVLGLLLFFATTFTIARQLSYALGTHNRALNGFAFPSPKPTNDDAVTALPTPVLMKYRLNDWKQERCDSIFHEILSFPDPYNATSPMFKFNPSQQLEEGFMFCVVIDISPDSRMLSVSDSADLKPTRTEEWILNGGSFMPSASHVSARFSSEYTPLFTQGILDRYENIMYFMHASSTYFPATLTSQSTNNTAAFFIASLHDTPHISPDIHHRLQALSTPLLSWNVLKELENATILVPDYYYLRTAGYFFDLSPKGEVPWEFKINRAAWRGSSTGFELITSNNWQDLPRARLCLFSITNPDLLDARITAFVQCDPEAEQIMRSVNISGDFISREHISVFKVLVDIDGNANSWEGCFYKLLSNSAMAKVESPYTQWFYNRLVPWVHYIPIKPDMSDLDEQLRYALAPENDEAMLAMAMEATNLAKSLTLKAEVERMSAIVLEYIRTWD